MTVGETATFYAFARGGLVSWDGYWNWQSGDAPLGTFNPSAHSTGAEYSTSFTATTTGFSKIHFRVTDDGGAFMCEGYKTLTVNPGCTSNCSPGNMCGQPDACSTTGGLCSTIDVGTPPAVTITSPTNGSSFIPTGNQFTVTWTPGSTMADSYYLEILPQGITCATAATAPGAFCGNSATTSYTVNPVPPAYSTWTARVVAINTSCSATNVSPIATSTFNLIAPISGTLYRDDAITCLPTATTQAAGAAGTLNVLDKNATNVVGTFGGGRTTFQALAPFWSPGGNNTVTLTPGVDGSGNQIYCACNAVSAANQTTCVKAGISSPQAAVNFYLTTIPPQDSWYQILGGMLYAGANAAEAVRSAIPPFATCTAPGCISALSARNTAGTVASDGPVMTAGGSINANSFITQRTPAVYLTDLPSTNFRHGYDYFYSRFDLGSTPTDYYGNARTNATKPSSNGVFYTNGNTTIDTAWNVASGESRVIFINGNLTVSQPITVQPGGYLAFIVKQDITFSSSLGNAVVTSATPVVEGVYIADRNLIVASSGGTDLRFVGAGTFVGWNGVTLSRDLGNVTNRTKPSELFILRPDFIQAMPDEMKEPLSVWQEINP